LIPADARLVRALSCPVSTAAAVRWIAAKAGWKPDLSGKSDSTGA
jgi:hypothetical protein